MIDTPALRPPEKVTLKQCLFCGGVARPSSRNGLTFFVECQTSYCAIIGPERCAVDAADAWNRRAPPDEATVERVARAIDPTAWRVPIEGDVFRKGRSLDAARAAIAAMLGGEG